MGPESPSRAATLVDLLRRRAAATPDATAFAFRPSGAPGARVASVRYEALDRRARAIAGLLQSLRLAGERALLVHPPGLDEIEAFFGALYAGKVAVPAAAPDPAAPAPALAALEELNAAAGACVVLTTSDTLALGESLFRVAPDLPASGWIATDCVRDDFARRWRPPDATDAAAALVRFGGEPGRLRGVASSHADLLAAAEQFAEQRALTQRDRGLCGHAALGEPGLAASVIAPVRAGCPMLLVPPPVFVESCEALRSGWRATFALGPSVAASAAPRTRWGEMRAGAQRSADRGADALGLERYRDMVSSLERLTTGYVVRALRDLGCYARAGEAHDVDALLSGFGIAPDHRKLLSRWLTRLVAAGLLERDGERFRCAEPLPAQPLRDLLAAAERDGADMPRFLEYVRSCGEALPGVITGAVSPLELMFPDGSFAVVEELYRDSPIARYCNGILRALLEPLVASMPLRVLELGAGTGGTSAALLPVLDAERTTYCYTDVSPLFLTWAKSRFASFPFVEYGTLDVERPLAEQGFEPESFDVVVAANVLHATRDLRAAVARARSLLRPGGALLLWEVSGYQACFDITFGLIAGWARHEDGVRGETPLLSAADWSSLLRASGFEEVASFPEPHAAAAILEQHVLAACLPAPRPQA